MKPTIAILHLLLVFFSTPFPSISTTCPTILFPPPMHQIPQSSSILHILLSHDRATISRSIQVRCFPSLHKYTPLPRYNISATSLILPGQATTTITLATEEIMLPLGSYGIYLSVNGKDCPKFTFVSIVPPISPSPSVLASTGASLIKILAPSEGETYRPGQTPIYLALHSSVRTFCIQLSHSSAIWCFPSDCEQPLLIENIETNSHILRVWSKDNVTTNDVVVFDVEPFGHAPFVHIVTPTPHQVMHVDSVWLKFQQRPSSLVNGTLLCINIDESKEVCGLDVEQPHQLSNVVEGEHQVCAWILDLKDNSGEEESARPENAVCHSFRVVTGVAGGGAGGAGGAKGEENQPKL